MTSQQQSTLDTILKQKMLPLYFNESKEVSIEVLKALYAAGIRTVEYTNRGAAALENFKAMVALRNESLEGLQLGIGTIKTVADAKAFLEAGADYIISPALIPDVIKFTQGQGKLAVPGCLTPSEIVAAEQLGVKFLKLFPGNLIGPGYVSAIKDLFPELYFMPTGGVDTTKESIKSWFDAGVVAVGMGSKLVSKERMQGQDYAGIKKATEAVAAIIESI
ncbi:MAG: bifunctional 4-hydroxy-2-oxoglutarate aldolase/2-dehydro-3-deoxy-phosphogluconate aldolase [Edaphocola sp.]